MFNRKFASLIVGLSLVAAAPAVAQTITVEGSPLPTATVSFADLDLGKPAGRAALDGRVRRAAELLCLDHGVRSVKEKMDQKGCLNFAVASARPQIAHAIDGNGTQFAGRKAIVVAAR